MLETFSASNFRNVTVEGVQFGSTNIFLGPNNSGKTNMIDAIHFFDDLFSAKAKGESGLRMALEPRGWNSLLNRKLNTPGEIGLKWALSPDQGRASLEYCLDINIGDEYSIPKEFYIKSEKIQYAEPRRGQNVPFKYISCHDRRIGEGSFAVTSSGRSGLLSLPVSQYDSVLNQLGALLESSDFRTTWYPLFVEPLNKVKDFFGGYKGYHLTNITSEKIVDSTKIYLADDVLMGDGRNFLSVLNNLENTYDFLDVFKDKIRDVLPGIESVKLKEVSEGNKILQLQIDGLRFSLKELSDGTLKAFVLCMLLFTPKKYSVLSLDEPEINIHPAWLKVLSGWIVNRTSAEQIFISTHSPDLLDGFTEYFRRERVFIFVFSKDGIVRKVTPAELDSFFQQGWELGDLYRVGEPQLGGWPW